ncbi:hypothetical protein Ddc_16155 [Ditylenchus destructor]|nr:hypothetical protein Ddc_16155 [Ditylenchus destructor]
MPEDIWVNEYLPIYLSKRYWNPWMQEKPRDPGEGYRYPIILARTSRMPEDIWVNEYLPIYLSKRYWNPWMQEKPGDPGEGYRYPRILARTSRMPEIPQCEKSVI